MLYSTTAEYDTAIAAVEAAINRSLGIGASSGSGVAGNNRTNTEVSFAELTKRLTTLKRERAILSDNDYFAGRSNF